jgi:hypothetical protein
VNFAEVDQMTTTPTVFSQGGEGYSPSTIQNLVDSIRGEEPRLIRRLLDDVFVNTVGALREVAVDPQV